MGGFEALTHMVGGVEKTYFQPINDADGTNGLLDVDANIEQRSHLRNAVEYLYWWSHASGTGLILGNTEIFTANVAELDGVDQTFVPQTYVDLGTGDFSMSFRWKDTEEIAINLSSFASTEPYFQMYYATGFFYINVIVNNANKRVFKIPAPDYGDLDEHLISFFVDRSAGTCVASIDGASVAVTLDASAGVITGTLTNIHPLTIGGDPSGGSTSYRYSGNLMSLKISLGGDLEQYANLEWNGGQAQCYALVDQDIKDTVTHSWRLYNHVGDTGNELVDEKGSNDLVNVNNIPFTGSAQIECEPHTPPVDIQWTQDFSLLDPVTDVVYGIDPAVTTWIDKGTSSTNLTQTTVAKQFDLLIGGTSVDNRLEKASSLGEMDGITAQGTGDFSIYSEFQQGANSDYYLYGTESISGLISKNGRKGLRVRAGGALLYDFTSVSELYSVNTRVKMMFVRSGTSVKIFIDGVLIDSRTIGAGISFDWVKLGFDDLSLDTVSFYKSKQIDRALTDAEAIDETTPDPIAWTRDFSLLDPATDVVYGIDPAVTTWIDKGTSSTNLTQTTVIDQPDIVGGDLSFSNGAHLSNLGISTSGDFTLVIDLVSFGGTPTLMTRTTNSTARAVRFANGPDMEVTDRSGSAHRFEGITTGSNTFTIVRDNNTLKCFRGLTESPTTFDVTGSVFDFEELGHGTFVISALQFGESVNYPT